MEIKKNKSQRKWDFSPFVINGCKFVFFCLFLSFNILTWTIYLISLGTKQLNQLGANQLSRVQSDWALNETSLV